jgi:hypothetical protein
MDCCCWRCAQGRAADTLLLSMADLDNVLPLLRAQDANQTFR